LLVTELKLTAKTAASNSHYLLPFVLAPFEGEPGLEAVTINQPRRTYAQSFSCTKKCDGIHLGCQWGIILPLGSQRRKTR
jgi:hypothetical protein